MGVRWDDKAVVIDMRVLGRILDIDILRREGAVFVMEEAENTLAPPEGCDTGNDDGRDSIGMFRVDIAVEVSGDYRPDVRVACERLSPLFETLSVFPAGNGFVVDEIVAIGNMGKDEGRFAGSLIKRLFQGGNGVEARERRYVLLANGFGADGHEEGFRGFMRLQEFAEVFFEDFGPFEIPFRVVVFVDRDVVVSENGQHGLWEESAEIGNAACNLFPEEVVGRKIASMDDAGNGDRQIVDCLDRLSEAPLVQRFSVMGIGNLHEPEIVCFCRESGKTDRRCDQAEEKENSFHICDDSKKRRQSGFVFFAGGFVDKTDGKAKRCETDVFLLGCPAMTPSVCEMASCRQTTEAVRGPVCLGHDRLLGMRGCACSPGFPGNAGIVPPEAQASGKRVTAFLQGAVPVLAGMAERVEEIVR